MQVKSERHAWELAKEAGFELVVVNPGLFIGPPATSRAAGESLDLMKKIFEGSFVPYPICIVRRSSSSMGLYMQREPKRAVGQSKKRSPKRTLTSSLLDRSRALNESFTWAPCFDEDRHTNISQKRRFLGAFNIPTHTARDEGWLYQTT